MTKKGFSASYGTLFGFGRQCLAAHRHPRDHHPFTVFTCSACGAKPLTLRIEHQTGSTDRDFKGVIVGRCSACGTEGPIFTFTGEHRGHLREEKPVCTCGHGAFLVAMVQRFEGEDGLPGFFDEGVIVGQCCRCGRNRAFVYTD